MGMLPPPLKSLLGWIRAHPFTLAGFAASLMVGAAIPILAAVRSSNDIASANDPKRIVREWQDSIAKLGLKAVFPPREDFYVGDLYAFDQDAQPANGIASMQIAHIAAADAAIRAVYSDLPRFPPSPENYDWISPVEVKEAGADIFSAPAKLRSLPIVAFPDITVTTARANTLAAALPNIHALFGKSGDSSESLRIRFPEAETYGLPADDAKALLDKFCAPSPGQINPACGQTRVRALLSSVAGGEVLCPKKAATPSNTPRAHTVGLVLIYRVYLTRSIDYAYGANTAVASEARAIQDRARSGQAPDAATSPEAAPKAGTPARVTAAMEEFSHAVGGIGLGGELSFSSATSNGALFKRKFARPLAFAYAAVFQDPIDDGCLGDPSVHETSRD